MPDKETKALMSQRNQAIAKASDDWTTQFSVTNNGGVRVRSLFNIRLILKNDSLLKGLLAFDEFADQIVKTKAITELHISKGFWSDADSSLVRSYIDEKYKLLFSGDNLADAITAVAHQQTFNPVKQRIETVKWDGKPRAVNYFIDYLGAENNDYTKAITKLWLTGLIGRVYENGIKFEIVPILVGKQGIGKSTCPRNLYPDKFNETLEGMGKSKDDYQKLQGSWIVEIAELSAMKKTDIEGVKSFISARFDTYRNSYGRFATQHPRKCVFIGTTNQQDFLKDATGERRFYPIKCGVNQPTKNVFKPDHNDILQVLAEAKTWFDSGVQMFPDKATAQAAEKYQSEASVIDLTRDAIVDYLNMKVPDNWDELTTSTKQSYVEHYGHQWDYVKDKISATLVPLDRTTTREIMAVVFHITTDGYLKGRTNLNAKKIKLIMDNIDGWEKNNNVVINGKRARGYIRT